MMSSQYGPNKLGYTGATKLMTKRSNFVKLSKSKKINVVQIILCKGEYEEGIASNRRIASYGEFVSRPSTHRPSRHGTWSVENG